MTKLSMILVALLLTGACSTAISTTARDKIAAIGAEEADALWVSTAWAMCHAQTVGALFRQVESQAKMDAYQAFCGRTGGQPVVTVAE